MKLDRATAKLSPMAYEVAAGLTSNPKHLSPKYFYDALGSRLFEAICELPEYGLTRAEERLPILDVHLHAMAADGQGPPPLALCTPFPELPAWDPAQPYGAAFVQLLKHPPCADPVWSPMTDEELMAQTIAAMERHDVFGVLSGAPDRVAAWMAAAPGRFIAGRELARQARSRRWSTSAGRSSIRSRSGGTSRGTTATRK